MHASPRGNTCLALPEILAVLLAVALLAIGVTVRGGENWPGFRGPTGLGYTDEKNLPLTWGGEKDENVLWKSALHGEGHASPIVWADRLLVCTACWPPGTPRREEVIPEHHVLCYQAGSGKLLWDTSVPHGPWLRNDFRSGPGGGYACPTPVTDGQLVYCLFGSSVIAALDFRGKIVWRREIVPHTFDTAIGSSPILFRDTVLLVCAMEVRADSRIVALDKQSGAVKWEKGLIDTGFGHSTPILIEVGRGMQMLFTASAWQGAGPNALQSVDPATGQRLWWCRGSGDTASPVYAAGLVYFDSGRGGPGTAVAPTGTGDVSQTHVKWSLDPMPKDMASPIIVDGRLYRLGRSGVLKCYELATGRPLYSGRLDGLSSTWASPIADPAGRIYFANAGKSFVIQAGAEFKILAANDLHDGSHPSPAVAAGRMYLVGQKQVFCIARRPPRGR
jgi:outer membrane protein assembly factor BamB